MPLNKDTAHRKDMNAGRCEMQHRHFAFIAGVLRGWEADSATVEAWADELSHTNPKFDRRRFVLAATA